MASQTRQDSNNFVLDMVSDVCRVEGFNVEKNVQADDSGDHFVDIIASRTTGKHTQKVAFECWEGDRQVNGREVEGFVNRLRTAGLSSGIYVSPKGFTGDAEFMARKLQRTQAHLDAQTRVSSILLRRFYVESREKKTGEGGDSL